MTCFTYILLAVGMLLPFAIELLVDSQPDATWHAPQSINPDIDVIRHYYGDGE